MNDLLAIYMYVALGSLAFFGLMMGLGGDEDVRKFGARAFTLSPVWPLVIVVLAAWLVVAIIHGLLRLALYSYRLAWK